MLDSVSTEGLDITFTTIRYARGSVEFSVSGPGLKHFKDRWLAHWHWSYCPIVRGNTFWRSESCD